MALAATRVTVLRYGDGVSDDQPETGASPAPPRRRRRWWKIPVLGLPWLATGVGFWNDVVQLRIVTPVAIFFALLTAIYVTYAAIRAVSFARRVRRIYADYPEVVAERDRIAGRLETADSDAVAQKKRLDDSKDLISDRDSKIEALRVEIARVNADRDSSNEIAKALEAKLERWKVAAGEAKAKADDLEERRQSWDLDNLQEGRRRAISELNSAAHADPPNFSDIDVGIVDDKLYLGATWSGALPILDGRYVVRSRTLGFYQAVVACVELRENKTAVFEVAAVKTPGYRESLIEKAASHDTMLASVEIVPRPLSDNLEEEPLWPEN